MLKTPQMSKFWPFVMEIVQPGVCFKKTAAISKS